MKTSVELMVGKRFGRLTVITDVIKYERRRFLCRCDCGNERVFSSAPLKKGSVVSCGCYHVENCRQKGEDLTGQTFNLLTVLEPGPYISDGKGIRRGTWLCRCICGSIKPVLPHHLKGGALISCGCARLKSKRTESDSTRVEMPETSVIEVGLYGPKTDAVDFKKSNKAAGLVSPGKY